VSLRNRVPQGGRGEGKEEREQRGRKRERRGKGRGQRDDTPTSKQFLDPPLP